VFRHFSAHLYRVLDSHPAAAAIGVAGIDYHRGNLSAFYMFFVTAADTILLVVKTAAAFAPAGQTSSPKSGLPVFFIPHLTPVAKKPFGPVIVLFVILNLKEL
jgi:hypothetical protein